ncbi:MAG: V4R domain-containing protein [Candidatus Zixiibacteriota bacterium]
MSNEGTDMFRWSDLGDVNFGRPNLGQNVPVLVYRLLQYTLKNVLVDEFGSDKANEIFIRGGRLAGIHFCRNLLNKSLPLEGFLSNLQKTLKDNSIGILRVESADQDEMHFVLTVAEDLDCSGLPFENKTVCQYDEGFISGVMEEYTGGIFNAKEIDCWASGDRVCRFDVRKE